MQVEDEVAKPLLVEALQDRVNRGSLLRDEEHTFPSRDERPDEIADRLALPGPRRPLDDEALSRKCCVDRVLLARIRVEHEELVCWRDEVRAGDRVRSGLGG